MQTAQTAKLQEVANNTKEKFSLRIQKRKQNKPSNPAMNELLRDLHANDLPDKEAIDLTDALQARSYERASYYNRILQQSI